MPPESASSVPPIPRGGVLLHIGPYKTGSSALQHALATARHRLADFSVSYPPAVPDPDYPGLQHRPARAAWAVTGQTPFGLDRPEMSVWDDFAAEVRAAAAAGRRVCVSGETFAAVTSRRVVGRVVDDLGGDRLHLLIVCRRLERLLPSVWQQRTRDGRERASFHDFLSRHLSVPADERRRTRVWRSQGMAHPLGTWMPPIPPERSIVLVMPDRDRDLLFRSAEHLLGLPRGFLPPPRNPNVSLPYERAELLRRVNDTVAAGDGWSERDYVRLLRRAVLTPMTQTPVRESETPVPALPGWARELLPELERERMDAIRASGARVIGDLSSLAREGDRRCDRAPADVLPLEVTVGVVAELFERLRRSRRDSARQERVIRELRTRLDDADHALAGVSSRDLLREVARRQVRRLRPG